MIYIHDADGSARIQLLSKTMPNIQIVPTSRWFYVCTEHYRCNTAPMRML
jgi:hypothetical protein